MAPRRTRTDDRNMALRMTARACVVATKHGAASACWAKCALASVTSALVALSGRNLTPASTCMEPPADSLAAAKNAGADVGYADLLAGGVAYGPLRRSSMTSNNVLSRQRSRKAATCPCVVAGALNTTSDASAMETPWQTTVPGQLADLATCTLFGAISRGEYKADGVEETYSFSQYPVRAPAL
jgi:hypothetical protein